MVKHIPRLLIISRLIMAMAIIVLGVAQPKYYQNTIAALIAAGLLTDIFDGIIARQIGVSNEGLRVLDSNVDQVFWLSVISVVFYLNSDFLERNWLWILLVFILEVSSYAISYLKFKRTVATHSILSKAWTISLLVFMIDLLLNHYSKVPFVICILLGIISRLENIIIILKLKTWQADIPSVLVVGRINRGETIKKSKLFNG